MRHIQMKLTAGQTKIVVPLAIDEYAELKNEESGQMERHLINKAAYKGTIKVTTKQDVLYFAEDQKDVVAGAILETNLRGSKALADKVRKAS